MDPTVDVGPVIERSEVDRIAEWVEEAVSQGAEVLTGGKGDGPFFQPTLLADVTPRDEGLPRGGLRPGRDDQPVPDFEEALAR